MQFVRPRAMSATWSFVIPGTAWNLSSIPSPGAGAADKPRGTRVFLLLRSLFLPWVPPSSRSPPWPSRLFGRSDVLLGEMTWSSQCFGVHREYPCVSCRALLRRRRQVSRRLPSQPEASGYSETWLEASEWMLRGGVGTTAAWASRPSGRADVGWGRGAPRRCDCR